MWKRQKKCCFQLWRSHKGTWFLTDYQEYNGIELSEPEWYLEKVLDEIDVKNYLLKNRLLDVYAKYYGEPEYA